ncbi:MAG: DUF1015 domain-containing protein [Nitrospirota bacterium]
MSEIKPFRGIIYNKEKVKDLNQVIAPPYDIISSGLQERLYRSSPYNIVRIDFGREYPDDTPEKNKYKRAFSYINDWLKEGILKRDESESIYIYKMDYLSPKGVKKTLRGFVCLVKLEDLSKGIILPHENTYSGPRVDRLNLLRATRTNTSLIFSLYPGEGKISEIIYRINPAGTALEVRDSDGTSHTLWAIRDTSLIDNIVKEIKNRPIFIADGHHRYETALLFRDEMRKKGEEGYDYVMMFLADIEDEGLTILPTHRFIQNIPISDNKEIRKTIGNGFELKTILTREVMLKELEEKEHLCFGMYIDGIYYLLTLKENALESFAGLPPALRNLDSAILHFLIFEKFLGMKNGDYDYERDVDEVIRKVDSGDFRIGFFMNPPKVKEVKEIALSGERMPPKTTFFYPKLVTGMVINKFD